MAVLTNNEKIVEALILIANQLKTIASNQALLTETVGKIVDAIIRAK